MDIVLFALMIGLSFMLAAIGFAIPERPRKNAGMVAILCLLGSVIAIVVSVQMLQDGQLTYPNSSFPAIQVGQYATPLWINFAAIMFNLLTMIVKVF